VKAIDHGYRQTDSEFEPCLPIFSDADVEVRSFKTKKEWRDAHFGIVTSSIAAGALGLDEKEYSTPLSAYYQVRGELPEVEETAAMRRGLLAEPMISSECARETGRVLMRPVDGDGNPFFLMVSKRMPWLGATPDRLFPVAGGFGVAELKLVTTSRAAGEWTETPPMRHRVQVHVQAEVCSALASMVVGMLFGGNLGGDLRWHDEPQGDVAAAFRAELFENLERFASRCQKGQRPDPRAADVDLIKRRLEGCFIPKRIKLPATMAPLLTRWKSAEKLKSDLREQLNVQEDHQREIEARVRLALGQYAQGVLPTGEVFYREETQVPEVTHRPHTRHRFGVFSKNWR
jgi:predicted phage-related endonuclease